MKKIFKEIERIMISGTYDEYRFIVSNNHIELKLRPISNNVDEINWLMTNKKENRLTLFWQLEGIK